MVKVFVSYASEDIEYAVRLHQWLVGEGHDVFLEQDLRDGLMVGGDWEQQLHERLRWADAMVCVVTSAFVASMWCTAEISVALSRGSRLLPVRAEPKVDHPLLKSVQYADLTVDSAAGRAALVAALRRIDAAGRLGWPDSLSPFPGLRPCDAEQRRVFFGRADETKELAELLRSPAEQAEAAALLVVGPSGCGKSSLVRAGLLPVMAEEPGWLTLTPILPGADPVSALVRELAALAQWIGLDWTVEYVWRRLEDSGLTRLADELLLADPRGAQRRLLLVVDQVEELVTQTPAAARARFAELLRVAMRGPVRVVGTLRPEFLEQLLADSELATLATSIYSLRPLRREALSLVIVGPARLAGIKITDDLVARLVADTHSGEALPLLAFTLAQLAEGVGRGGQLSSARYNQLGGVQGAVARQAEAALAEASGVTGRRHEEVIAGLLRLVTVDEQGRPTRWRVPYYDLPELMISELDAFVRRRLLTTDTDHGCVVVGVAHEAFLSAWPPLAQAIRESALALRTRRVIEQAATEWLDSGRPPAMLWERGRLAGAVIDIGARLQARDLITSRVELSGTARAFLLACIRRDRIRRWRLFAAVLFVLFGVLMLWLHSNFAVHAGLLIGLGLGVLAAPLLERINYWIRLRRPPRLTRRRTAAATVVALAISGIVYAVIGVVAAIGNQLSSEVRWAWLVFDIVLSSCAGLIGWTAYRTVKSNAVIHRGGAADSEVMHSNGILDGIGSIFDIFGITMPSRHVSQPSPWENLEQCLTEKYRRLEVASISGEHNSRDEPPSGTQPMGGSDR